MRSIVIVAYLERFEVSLGSRSFVLDDGEKLSILIEKDFACLAPRAGEDEADMYPHPNVDSAEC